MGPLRIELRCKEPSGLLVAALLIFNGLGLALVLTAGRHPISLYVRNALFAEVVDDQQPRRLPRSKRFSPHRIQPSRLPGAGFG